MLQIHDHAIDARTLFPAFSCSGYYYHRCAVRRGRVCPPSWSVPTFHPQRANAVSHWGDLLVTGLTFFSFSFLSICYSEGNKFYFYIYVNFFPSRSCFMSYYESLNDDYFTLTDMHCFLKAKARSTLGYHRVLDAIGTCQSRASNT